MITTIYLNEDTNYIIKRAIKDGLWSYRTEILRTDGWQRNKAIERLEAGLRAYYKFVDGDYEDAIDRSVEALEDWFDMYEQLEETLEQ